MSSGGAGSARLVALTKELTERWQQTRETWRDSKATEFEERYVRELRSAVDSAANSIAQLESLLRKIRSDCE